MRSGGRTWYVRLSLLLAREFSGQRRGWAGVAAMSRRIGGGNWAPLSAGREMKREEERFGSAQEHES